VKDHVDGNNFVFLDPLILLAVNARKFIRILCLKMGESDFGFGSLTNNNGFLAKTAPDPAGF
jgi:hypothetical protein